LDPEIILKLDTFGEIGIHGTKHDGKLIQLKEENIIKRLHEAKCTMENLVGHKITGFRAPLLQHNEKILIGLKKTGYRYDMSIPTWEPKHPSTMKPQGIGTVYPLRIKGMREIPLSIPQDHQMIKILGLNLKQTIDEWIQITELIRELGGICTFLIHPDYDFAFKNNLHYYEDLLNFLVSDSSALKTMPMKLIRN
jgi:peptidoglycan/xylan/chitin deacetylase (PgdA/CDA1 family)